MYLCGPTVYSRAHIGNFRAYIFEDLLQRHLELRGYKVHRVMNITDVDDKTIRGAREARRQEKIREAERAVADADRDLESATAAERDLEDSVRDTEAQLADLRQWLNLDAEVTRRDREAREAALPLFRRFAD